MSVFQLIYVSRRDAKLSEPEMQQIIQKSAENNADRDISGVLMCYGENLMQLLEGGKAEVESLFETIAADPRHTNVQCLLRKDVRKRLFPEWGMGIADLKSGGILNRDRLIAILDDARSRTNFGVHGVEARILLNDFKDQLIRAA